MNDDQSDRPAYKLIRFRTPEWEIIMDLANDMNKDRPRKLYLPEVVMETVKFYRDHHKSGGDAFDKAQFKGVITE